jgi:hypothetical protein
MLFISCTLGLKESSQQLALISRYIIIYKDAIKKDLGSMVSKVFALV